MLAVVAVVGHRDGRRRPGADRAPRRCSRAPRTSTATRSTSSTWIPAGAVPVEFGFFVDTLTACLLIVVTTIGMLVHIYSIGYMSHDPGYWRFFAYLNLFMFSMLLLVLADSWLVVFVAWELVGLSSYLLIGFWYRKRSAALAAKKAFIVNRVGDVGFALGIMAIFVNTERGRRGDPQHPRVDRARCSTPGDADPIPLFVVALLVFAGAMGKSAQFPLHVWLPDAMEGPTPVSALIHAATMVNAGVYLVARANPLFARAPDAMVVVAGDRHLHGHPRRVDRDDPDRHQARPRLLDAEPARLHVRGARRRRVHGGDLPPHDPRLLQGPAVPRLGLGDPRRPRGAGHAPDGRPVEEDPDHLRRRCSSARSRSPGIPPLAGFFSKDEILGEAFKLGFQWVWAIGLVVAVHDRVLHVPAHGPDVLGQVPRARRRSGTRSTSRRRS